MIKWFENTVGRKQRRRCSVITVNSIPYQQFNFNHPFSRQHCHEQDLAVSIDDIARVQKILGELIR